MPKIKGAPKEKTTVGIDPLNFRMINEAIEKNEFSTVTDLVNTALAFYFENRNRSSSKDDFKAWLVSKDGETFMKGLIIKTRKEK